MKRILNLLVFCLAPAMLSAAPCGSASLSTYTAIGFSCEVDAAVFSNFSFQLQNASSDTTPLTEDEITVSPIDLGTRIGLRFAGAFAALGAINGPGPTDGLRNNSYRFFFDVNRPNTLFTNTIAILNAPSLFAPDPFEFGRVIGANYIANDAAQASVTDLAPFDQQAFNTPRSSVDADTSISLTGGGSLFGTNSPVGLVTLRSADFLYDYETAVIPEPGTWALLASGFAGLLAVKRFRRN